MKSKFINSPLASNVVLGFILAGFEKLVESEFACPCRPEWNALFASAYFVFPGVIASVLMLCSQGCKLKTRQELKHLILFGIVPSMMWLILLFLDGQYYACAKTDCSGSIVDNTAYQKWCKPDNSTSSQEKMSQTQQWFYHSQVRNNLISLKQFI